jgi:hypothetical protein
MQYVNMSTGGDWASGSGSITIPRLVNMRGSYVFQYMEGGVTPIATSDPVTFKDPTEITQVLRGTPTVCMRFPWYHTPSRCRHLCASVQPCSVPLGYPFVSLVSQ